MGEDYHGHQLGTTEDLGYVRYDELAAVIDPDLERYRQPDRFRYRFPWPDEEGQTLAATAHRRLDRTWVVYPTGVGLQGRHQAVAAWIPAAGMGGVNVFLPCPLSKPFPLRHSPLPDPEPVAICAEKRAANGTMYTVFGCPLCHTTWSTDEDAIVAMVRAALRRQADEDMARGALDRAHWYRAVAGPVAAHDRRVMLPLAAAGV